MRTILVFLFVLISTGMLWGQDVFLNEIRADDASTDDEEFVEIIGPTGLDISGYQLIHYNGGGGSVIFEFTFPDGSVIPNDAIFDSEGNALGLLVVCRSGFPVPNFDYEWDAGSGLQNGPDGIEFLDKNGVRIQALTWKGLGDLSGGDPAWRDIGTDDTGDNGLSAPDGIQEFLNSMWSSEPATPGTINNNQTSGDISLPVSLSSFVAMGGNKSVTLQWVTESEVNNAGFEISRAVAENGDYVIIASYQNVDALKGQINSNTRHEYQFIDTLVINGFTYWYKLIDVDLNGNRNFFGPVFAKPEEITGMKIENGSIPEKFVLYQNYPNPFNPSTHLKFDIPELEKDNNYTSVFINNAVGQQVKSLFGGFLAAGSYTLEWDGTNDSGNLLPSGIYYGILKIGNFQKSIKMMLTK